VSRHLVEAPSVPSRRRSDVPIPAALDALILRGMEKSRELRFPTATAFREALEEIAPADTGRVSSTANQRAQMPTARISGAGATAVVPSSDPANHFGVTTQMPRRSRRLPVALGFVLVLAGAAVLLLRAQKLEPPPEATAQIVPPAPATTTTNAPRAAPATEIANVPAGQAPAALPAVAVAATGAAATGADEPAAPAHGPELAPHAQEAAPAKAPSAATHAASSSKVTAKKHKSPEHAERGESHAPAETASPAPSAAAAPAAAVAAAPPPPAAEERAAPAPRGPREVLAEGEKLLGQGEVRDACARGEEAKRMNPKLGPTYKFLGKCYMREGNAKQANDNYRKYLELSPNASDAMFIKSIIK